MFKKLRLWWRRNHPVIHRAGSVAHWRGRAVWHCPTCTEGREDGHDRNKYWDAPKLVLMEHGLGESYPTVMKRTGGKAPPAPGRSGPTPRPPRIPYRHRHVPPNPGNDPQNQF